MSETVRPTTQELLKLIGKTSGKGLSQGQARQLFDGLLSNSLEESQAGAALMALRVRGESVNEMLGALDALGPHLCKITLDKPGPVVVIPSYNGSRQIPNLVPLLASLLADEGISVLVHGVRHCPGRISTCEIFHAMGIESIEAGPCDLSQSVNNSLARGDPAFVPVDVLSPALARLLGRREQMGVRNTGHSMVKLLQPVRGVRAVQLVSYTHAEFHVLQQEVLQQLGGAALQSRGCEGEAVAHPKRAMVHHWIHQGLVENLGEGDLLDASDQPVLPAANSMAATATWIQGVLSGAIPVPLAIARQIDAIRRALNGVVCPPPVPATA